MIKEQHRAEPLEEETARIVGMGRGLVDGDQYRPSSLLLLVAAYLAGRILAAWGSGL